MEYSVGHMTIEFISTLKTLGIISTIHQPIIFNIKVHVVTDYITFIGLNYIVL